MDYTLRFASETPLTPEALADYFEARPNYRIERRTRIVYENADTGVTFAFRLEDETVIALDVEALRPPFFGFEAEIEAGRLVHHFELKVWESEPYAAETLVCGYAQENVLAHKELVEQGSEYHELPGAVLERAWRWNHQRKAIEHLFGESTFVPKVVCVLDPDTGQACTAAVWPVRKSVLLPYVDILLLTDEDEAPAWIATRDAAHLLALVGIRSARFCYRLEDGLTEAGFRHVHVDVSKDTELGTDVLALARRDGEPPQELPMSKVLSRELTRLALGIGGGAGREKTQQQPAKGAVTFPRECEGFRRTKRYELRRALGGYTWLSPWKIEAIAVSQGGNVVAGVGAGGVVFFDAESGTRLREVRGDVYAGTSVGISADSKTLAIGDELGNVNVFDLDLTVMGGGLTLLKRSSYGIRDLEENLDGAAPYGYVLGVSADGSVVVGGAGDHVFVLRDKQETTTFEVRGAVCASSDLSRLWTGTSVRDLTTGEESLRLSIDPLRMRVPALSPDGANLAFATARGDLQVIRLADGFLSATVSRKDARGAPVVARFIAYMPDGKKLVVGDQTGLEVRSASTLEREKVFSDAPVWDAALSNSVIYRAAGDRIWTQPLDRPAPPVNDGPITQLFHSARGPIAVLASIAPKGDSMTGGRAILWHLPSGEVLRATPRLLPERINLSPDGRLLHLATESSLRVLDVGTLEEVAVVEPLGAERFVVPLDLDASPDGEHVLVCLEDGLARMISIKTGRDLWRDESIGIRCATFTPDGELIVAGDKGRIRAIDAATGDVQMEIAIDDHRENGEHVLLGDGTRAVRVVLDEGIVIVDLASASAANQAILGAREALAASPGGDVIALTVAGDDGSDELLLWSVDDQQELDRIRFATADDAPISAAFSPDGKTLLVGTSRGALLVFAALS